MNFLGLSSLSDNELHLYIDVHGLGQVDLRSDYEIVRLTLDIECHAMVLVFKPRSAEGAWLELSFDRVAEVFLPDDSFTEVPVSIFPSLTGEFDFLALGQARTGSQSANLAFDGVNIGVDAEQISMRVVDPVPSPVLVSDLSGNEEEATAWCVGRVLVYMGDGRIDLAATGGSPVSRTFQNVRELSWAGMVRGARLADAPGCIANLRVDSDLGSARTTTIAFGAVVLTLKQSESNSRPR